LGVFGVGIFERNGGLETLTTMSDAIGWTVFLPDLHDETSDLRG